MGESRKLRLLRGFEAARGELRGQGGYRGSRVLSLVGECRGEVVVV